MAAGVGPAVQFGTAVMGTSNSELQRIRPLAAGALPGRAAGRMVSSSITARAAGSQPRVASSSRPRASDNSRSFDSSISRPIAVAIESGSCGSQVSSGITSSLIEEEWEPTTGTPQP